MDHHHIMSIVPAAARSEKSVESNTPMVIDQLAAQAGMSRRTFLRRFHDATGTTPGEWMLSVRLEKACALLENGTLSIDRVAEQAGFGSPETLRHHFRQRLGTTPTQWRKGFVERDLVG